jgi:hypothetical protein
VITITMAKRNLRGKTMELEPSVSQGQVVWHCTSIDIPHKYLPRQCR